MQKAIFLDRDGTINFDSGYVFRKEDCVLLEGAKDGLTVLKSLGYLLIIITNQSGIGRGLYTLEDAHQFHIELEHQLGFCFDYIFLCPHTPEMGCLCRKPQTTARYTLEKQFCLDLKNSFFIGDRVSDIECWYSAGCKTVYIENTLYPYTGSIVPDWQVDSILDFAHKIENI